MGSRMPNCLRTAMKRMTTTPMASSSMSWIPIVFNLLGDPRPTVQTPAGANNPDPWKPVSQSRGFRTGELQSMNFLAWNNAAGRRLNSCRSVKHAEIDINGKNSCEPTGGKWAMSRKNPLRGFSRANVCLFTSYFHCSRHTFCYKIPFQCHIKM